MRFELFEGARTLGTVGWERPGRIRLRLRDEALSRELATRLGGSLLDPEPDGSILLSGDGWTTHQFEAGLLDAAKGLGLIAAARPAGPEQRPRRV